MFLESGNLMLELGSVSRPAVKQNEHRAFPVNLVVHSDAIDAGVMSAGGRRPTGREAEEDRNRDDPRDSGAHEGSVLP